MSEFATSKFRIKFLRTSTIEKEPVKPGNFFIDMERQHVYIDTFDVDGDVQRIDLTGGVKYMGTVPTVDDLPAVADNGAMYNVDADGTNYVYNATLKAWDKLSETLDLTVFYTKTETDQILSNYVHADDLQDLIDMLNEATAEMDNSSSSNEGVQDDLDDIFG